MTVRLTQVQMDVVSHGEGALLVEAGPGSGKTRVLTERIRRLLAQPAEHFRVLALTFTNKAANEMIERLEDVPDIRRRAFIGTLHSFCMEVLANRGKPVGVDGLPNIFESFDDRRQVLANALSQDPHLSALLRQEGDTREQVKALSRWLERISELKNTLVDSTALEDSDERALYECYSAGLRASNALDYDDLLLLTYRLFVERPSVAEFYQRQYRYISIDEAQDLNEAQYRLLTSLCGSSYRNVMIVGDPKQAIYVWNGASPKYLELFARDFGARRISLNENFRCSREVVDAARRLDPSYEVGGQLPVRGQVAEFECQDEDDEAGQVVSRLRALLIQGHPDIEGAIEPNRCAVLGRNRFVFGALERRLAADGIPFHKRLSGAAFQSESDLVKGFELALRLLANPRDRLHLEVLARLWDVRLDTSGGAVTVARPGPLELVRSLKDSARNAFAPDVWAAIEAMQWTGDDFRLLRALDSIQSSAGKLAEEERALVLNDIGEWRKHWDYHVRSETGGGHSIGAFLGQIALGSTQNPNEDGVALLTVHSAKGMEFDVVFLIGLVEGTFPDYRARGASLDEERRSAFVAVTRSKRLLYLYHSKTRLMPWGAVRQQQPSRYLAAIMGRT